MGTAAAAMRHAGSHYRKLFARARHPVGAVEREAHHLHEIERTGESAETPYIAMLGLFLFLASVLSVLLCIALCVYYFA
jgi:hypothetical protein